MSGLTLIVAAVAALGAPGEAPVDYVREVKPILTARCVSCHGAIRQKAGLRLDTAALARKGGNGGPALEPGKSLESLMVERVTAKDVDERMPPESEGTPLAPEEVATLRRWIDQGANAPNEPTPPDPRNHWAYQPPTRPPVPSVPGSDGSLNPIDAFLAQAHAARGLTPAQPARPDVWLRRVTLDLVGTPPTPEALREIRRDDSPEARRRVVDRLLADPGYGERWGRHWLDVWRYSDWYGLGAEIRYSHPHIWRWRDWVVESLNADKGYDQMVLEMLAGDELAPGDASTSRATGYLVRNWDTFNRNVWLASIVEHTSRAFLGVTMQCAKCHDHKFDPVSQTEFYRLRAFFEPHQIRIDRVPGQPDRTKDGISRVFDDDLDRPTYRFIRGDETRPEESRPLTPGTPAVLGGEVRIQPIPLPPPASKPDRREFVVREAVAELEAARSAAEKALTAAKTRETELLNARKTAETADREAESRRLAALGKPDAKAATAGSATAAEALLRASASARDATEDRTVAESALAAATARLETLRAVLEVERVEEEGGKGTGSESWAEAARQTSQAQRRASVAEAGHALATARRDTERANRTLEGLLAASTALAPADPVKAARQKAATALVEARGRLSAAEKQLAEAENAAKQPVTTAYTPRPLNFNRAKVTYRDTPSTAPYPATSSGRRLALARWIVDPRNPLAARVAVNHIWARHFGEPLAASTYDFGLRTPRPELLPLLDWLAAELVDSGWSMKHIHRIICTSRAYAMRSDARGLESNARVDPDNHLVWRANVRRMEGEVIRDSVLSLAGRLSPKLGGPEQLIADAEKGDRRTIYYRYANGDSIPFLATFDAPSVVECYRRHETVVPQQALALSNSGMILARSADIATRIEAVTGRSADAPTRNAFVAEAFERVLGRPPTPEEVAECVGGLSQLSAAVGGEAKARAALVHVLLNHNDFVTIR